MIYNHFFGIFEIFWLCQKQFPLKDPGVDLLLHGHGLPSYGINSCISIFVFVLYMLTPFFCTKPRIDRLCNLCCFLPLLSNFAIFFQSKVKQIRSNCGTEPALNVEFKILLFSRITVVFVHRVFISHQNRHFLLSKV